MTSDQAATIQAWAGIVSAGLGLISTILWGVYVYFTRKTLQEVQKQTLDIGEQTRIQTSARLVSSVNWDGSPMIGLSAEARRAADDWEDRLKKNAQHATGGGETRVLKLVLRNSGHVDVVRWALTVHLRVTPGPALTELAEASYSWTVSSDEHPQHAVIATRDQLIVAVAVPRFFPQAEFGWSIEFADDRGKTYRDLTGTLEQRTENKLALERAPRAPALPQSLDSPTPGSLEEAVPVGEESHS